MGKARKKALDGIGYVLWLGVFLVAWAAGSR